MRFDFISRFEAVRQERESYPRGMSWDYGDVTLFHEGLADELGG
jgi:hypothetical protein